jgi:hypothetical protein
MQIMWSRERDDCRSDRFRLQAVTSSVKRCRMVKDRIRLWKQGVRDLVTMVR